MTRDRDIEQVLEHWLTDGANVMPDRVYQAIFDRVERQPQAVRPRLVRRLPAMNHPIRLLAGAAAVIAIALVGFGLLGGRGTPAVGGPAASPTTSPTAPPPSPSSSTTRSDAPSLCLEGGGACAGALTAGEHTSNALQPPMTFTVPERWINTVDLDRAYRLTTNDVPGPEILVMSQLAIPEQDAACTIKRKAGAGNTVEDWLAFLETHPGLDITNKRAASVGGNQGWSLEARVRADWTQGCADQQHFGGPGVFLFTDSGATPVRFQGIDKADAATITVLDVGGEPLIITVTTVASPIVHDQVVAAAQPIIDSTRFSP